MKKTKKLAINRETIRQLGMTELAELRGAVDTNPNTAIPLQCAQTSAGPGCSVYICVDTQRCPGTQWSVTC